MPRLRAGALLLLGGLGAFYLGGLVEFQLGGFAPGWVKTLFLYQAPAHGLDFAAIQDVVTTIEQHYVKPNPDGTTLTHGAESGIVGALGDSFSRYETPQEYQANQNFLQGTFAGIGATVAEQNNQLEIDSIVADTPASRAGLHTADVIVSVDGQTTKGWSADQAVNRIRGNAGTHVVLEINRNGQQLRFDLVRAMIVVPSVATHIFDSRVLYMRIFDFGDRTAAEFDSALKKNLTGSVSRVVLDLRDNPGGFVDAANDVISQFVRSGTSTILVQRGGSRQVESVTGSGRAYRAPLVVLVNENTASASEITAGAIEDHHRGTLVGVKTFGKGSVQQDFLVRNGDLHLTIAYWLTPDGHSINQVGITPDAIVQLPKAADQYAVDQAPNSFSQDTQLAIALKLVGGSQAGLPSGPVSTLDLYAGRRV